MHLPRTALLLLSTMPLHAADPGTPWHLIPGARLASDAQMLVSTEAVTHQGFALAQRIEIMAPGRVEYRVPVGQTLAGGQELAVGLWLRSANRSQGAVDLQWAADDSSQAPLSAPVTWTLSDTWQQQQTRFTAPRGVPAATSRLVLRLSGQRQTIDLGALALTVHTPAAEPAAAIPARGDAPQADLKNAISPKGNRLSKGGVMQDDAYLAAELKNWIGPGAATESLVPVSGRPFNTARRIEILQAGKEVWQVQLLLPLVDAPALKSGSFVELALWLRSPTTNPKLFAGINTSADHQSIDIFVNNPMPQHSDSWQQYRTLCLVHRDTEPGSLEFVMALAHQPQIIEIGPVTLVLKNRR